MCLVVLIIFLSGVNGNCRVLLREFIGIFCEILGISDYFEGIIFVILCWVFVCDGWWIVYIVMFIWSGGRNYGIIIELLCSKKEMILVL